MISAIPPNKIATPGIHKLLKNSSAKKYIKIELKYTITIFNGSIFLASRKIKFYSNPTRGIPINNATMKNTSFVSYNLLR